MQIKKEINKLATIGIFLSLTGCSYPVYKKMQPQSEIVILDESQKPLANVKVELHSKEQAAGGRAKHWKSTKLTTQDGIAEFESRREWRIESLMIHGMTFVSWKWCIEKEGFKTIRTSYLYSDKFKDSGTFILKKGNSVSCDKNGLVSAYGLNRFDNNAMKNDVKAIIEEMLVPSKAREAYGKLEKLGKKYVPYIVLEMDDFRALPVRSISLRNKSANAFEGIRHIGVEKVTDVLSEILTQLTGHTSHYGEIQTDEDRIENIYG